MAESIFNWRIILATYKSAANGMRHPVLVWERDLLFQQ